jgi:hypothetical protein
VAGHVTIATSGKANGLTVSDGEIVLPRAGAWHADLNIDTADVISGKVEIRVGTAGILKGTISRAAVYRGHLRARIVAGGDGLRKDATPRHFTTPTIGIVLRDLAKGVGETVSATASAAVMGVQLEHWTTIAMPAGEMLALLLERAPAGTAWRLGPDGAIWVGPETWPDSGIAPVEVAATPEDAVVELALDTPWVLPGTMVGTRKVDLAQLAITGGAVQATIWTAP